MTPINYKTVCAWCGTHMNGPTEAPLVSHGICGLCWEAEMADLEYGLVGEDEYAPLYQDLGGEG